MRALLYPYGSAVPLRLCCTLTALPPASFCRPPLFVDSLGEHYAQGFVTGISFLSASAGGSVSYFCHSGEISDRTPEPSDKGLVSWHREYFALKGKKHHARESEQARHGTVRPE